MHFPVVSSRAAGEFGGHCKKKPQQLVVRTRKKCSRFGLSSSQTFQVCEVLDEKEREKETFHQSGLNFWWNLRSSFVSNHGLIFSTSCWSRGRESIRSKSKEQHPSYYCDDFSPSNNHCVFSRPNSFESYSIFKKGRIATFPLA